MARRKQKFTGDNGLTVSPWQLDAPDVERLRRQYAKQANQRLVRLERRKASTGESLADLVISQYAYEQIRIIRTAEGKPTSGKLRFKESARPANDEQARMELYVLQNFLGDPTSRAGTAAKYVSKTEQTFKERGITSSSYKSFYNFLNSAPFATLKEELNSNDIVELYNKAHENGWSFRKIDAAIKDYLAALDETEDPATIKDLENTLGVKLLT